MTQDTATPPIETPPPPASPSPNKPAGNFFTDLWTNHRRLTLLTAAAAVFLLISLIIYLSVGSRKSDTPSANPSPTPQPTLPPMQPYQGDTFHISYPKDWTAGKVDVKKIYYFSDHTPTTDVHNTKLYVETLGNGLTEEQEVKEHLDKGFTKQACNYKLSNCTFLNRTTSYQGTQLYDATVIFPGTGKTYILTIEYPADQNQKEHEAVINAMINSLQAQ